MDEIGQAASNTERRAQEQGKLIVFAERIANEWASLLGFARDSVEWVAVKGGRRTPITGSGAEPIIHPLENDAGIAFVLGAPGVMDLLFVVTYRKAGYSVSISNNGRQGDRSERHDVRPDYVGDVKNLLAAAKRFMRRVAA